MPWWGSLEVKCFFLRRDTAGNCNAKCMSQGFYLRFWTSGASIWIGLAPFNVLTGFPCTVKSLTRKAKTPERLRPAKLTLESVKWENISPAWGPAQPLCSARAWWFFRRFSFQSFQNCVFAASRSEVSTKLAANDHNRQHRAGQILVELLAQSFRKIFKKISQVATYSNIATQHGMELGSMETY